MNRRGQLVWVGRVIDVLPLVGTHHGTNSRDHAGFTA